MRRLVMLVAIILAACSRTPLPADTPLTPRDSPSATAALPTLVGATPTGTAIPTPDQTPSPSKPPDRGHGPNDVLLRMSSTGGLPYPGATVEHPPEFTLYGDGRVIYFDFTPDGGIELRHARITDERVDDLLAFALDEGGLGEARELYGQLDEPVYDFGTTIFDIDTGAVDKAVSVYAVGTPGNPDAIARRKFARLASELDFEDEVARGDATDLGVFEPEAYLITLDEVFDPMTANTDWPWDGLTLDDFEPSTDETFVRTVSPDLARVLADPPIGAPNDIAVTASDGQVYFVRVRPLLPDQLPADWAGQ